MAEPSVTAKPGFEYTVEMTVTRKVTMFATSDEEVEKATLSIIKETAAGWDPVQVSFQKKELIWS